MLSEDAAREAVIVALDMGKDEACALADKLSGRARWVKVGMTLFYAHGPAMVQDMKDRGFKVFLDLKLHDIPFQIEGAAASAASVGADIISIHGLGGSSMIAGARAGVERVAQSTGNARARLVAITVLTSMDQDALTEIGVRDAVDAEVKRLASMACASGSDGIVCSPKEAANMRELLGPDALIVTPGVRPLGSDVGDQKRIATPAAAIAQGASKLVIGRPITRAEDPVVAFENVVHELVTQ